MQSSTLVILLGVCSQLLLPHECRQICSQDQYTVKENGGFVRCLSCAKCHPGWGLSPVCGSDISPTQKIECQPCPPGKFSNTYDSAPCQNCHECITHEVVASNCTKLSDRKCSGTCVEGYYFVKKTPHIHTCQQCSYCCFDGKDVIQEECVMQGLNATNQHCSQRKSKKCAPKPTPATNLLSESASRSPSSSSSSSSSSPSSSSSTSSSSPSSSSSTSSSSPSSSSSTSSSSSSSSSSSPSSLLSSSSTTDPPTNHKNNTLTIVLGVLVGIVLAALVGTILYYRRRKAKLDTSTPTASGPSQPNNILPINGGNVQEKIEKTENPTCPENQVIIPEAHTPQDQEVSPMSRLPWLQNEGFASSAQGTPCHTDDELDDLPDVVQRTKRLVKRQHSREAPKDDEDEKLLDLTVRYSAGRKDSIHGESAEGAEGGQRRRSSSGSIRLPQLIRKLSLGSKDYQPVQDEDPDDFKDSLTIMKQPIDQKGKEGSKVVFRCEARGKNKITYQWLKDKLKLPEQTNSSLVFDSVKPRDFGCYSCEVRCSDGQNKSEPVKLLSRAAELDVLPREGMRFKYLTEVFRDNLQIQESVEKLLQKKVPDAGGWKQLAHKYEMAEETRDSLEGCQERGKSVIEYLKSAHPQLTVYEFCKYLKDIKRNDIIIALSDHLVSVAN